MSNFYPDLKDEDKPATTTYQATTTTTTTTNDQQKKKKNKQNDGCCLVSAKIWITIIGILNLVLGLFVVCTSLYAKFAYSKYDELNESLPTGGIWMILSFGVILTVCSIVLMLATCLYDRPCFKMVLVVFAIILMLLLIMEVASAAVFVWGLGVISLPKSKVSDGISNGLLEARDKAVAETYNECCVKFMPPYNAGNLSKIDSGCLWPNSADVVKEKCGSQNVLECVCSSKTEYGAYFGLFLQSKLMWVGAVTIVLAILLLLGLIATCVLICAKKKKNDATYKEAPEEQ